MYMFIGIQYILRSFQPAISSQRVYLSDFLPVAYVTEWPALTHNIGQEEKIAECKWAFITSYIVYLRASKKG